MSSYSQAQREMKTSTKNIDSFRDSWAVEYGVEYRSPGVKGIALLSTCDRDVANETLGAVCFNRIPQVDRS